MAMGNDLSFCMKHKVRMVNGICNVCALSASGDRLIKVCEECDTHHPADESCPTCATKVKVVDFKSASNEPGERVVELLEAALAAAKKGDIENVMIVAVEKNADVWSGWANGSQPFSVVGALESVKLEFMNSCIEKRD